MSEAFEMAKAQFPKCPQCGESVLGPNPRPSPDDYKCWNCPHVYKKEFHPHHRGSVMSEVIQVENVSAWHFAKQSAHPYIMGWNCVTGETVYGHEARMKMVEDGSEPVSEEDNDRRRWWATANPELAKGKPWWAMPTPDDAPLAGPVSPFRGGWKDYGVVTGTSSYAEEHRLLYGNPRMPFAPAGASPLSEKGYDVNEPKET